MEQIQFQHDTAIFRDTDILRTARQRLEKLSRPLRILSFGCSVGDEVATLRLFFPDADIFGCDISPEILAVAQSSVGHMGHIFLSEEAALRAAGPFDLITAFSVLCLNPRPKDVLDRFPPEKFDEMVGLLADLLAPKGLLALVNTTYRFRDSPVFAAFDPVRSDQIWNSGFVDICCRDGRLFKLQGRIPRKGEGFSVADDEELTECLFEKRVSGPQAIHWEYVAAVPKGLVVYDTLVRNSADFLKDVPEDGLTFTLRHEFAYNPVSERCGVIMTRSWKSNVHEGEHIRPAIWSPMGGLPLPARIREVLQSGA